MSEQVKVNQKKPYFFLIDKTHVQKKYSYFAFENVRSWVLSFLRVIPKRIIKRLL